MVSKTVEVNGKSMHYYDSEGAGTTFVMVHGNSASGMSFRHQLEGAFGQANRVLALDLPGHGQSESLAGPESYSLPSYAAAVAGAAQALDLADAIFVGWSLGGHILLEGVSLLPNAKGFVIFGTPPLAFPPDMENAFMPNPAVNIGFSPVVDQAQAEAYATSFFTPETTPDLTPFVEDILKTDGNARAGLGASIAPDMYADEVIVVGEMKQPLAIFHGVGEQLVNGAYFDSLTMPTLWRGAVQMIDGAGHAPQVEQPETFNQLLSEFSGEIAG